MSACCANCKTWPGCDDWLYGNGLGSLDLPPNQAGAAFSLGVEVSGWDTLTDPSYWTKGGLLEDIRIAVQQGGFVQIPVNVYSLTGNFNWNPFIVIEGRAKYAHASATHLKDAILGSLGTVIGYNSGSVRFEIDTYDPATGAANTDVSKRRYDAPTGGNNSAPPEEPKSIDWPDWVDKLSAETGLGPWQIIGGLTVLTIGGVLVLKSRF